MISQIHHGYHAKKRFGQHFLHDQYIINTIINAICPQYGQVMLEIGPGLGALTEKIEPLINKLTVIEIDRDLALYLKNNSQLKDKINILHQDALIFDFSNFSHKQGQLLRIFGNLPYNISTPLIFHLFSHINVIDDMHFMLQKEVADRLLANPGNKSYGRLSVMSQYYCQMFPVILVPANALTPTPKVKSTVVRFIPIRTIIQSPTRINSLNRITTAAFNQRRKKIRNSLQYLISLEELIKMNISPDLRAENISVLQYCQLADWLTKHY
ncbi:16S rRNA (adenine(1518)-N(6)/adenine(1519)-N(6))-dimethyltransferase RsmA [Candidatus Erwinia haradaeae]|uniref:Ribosomal RNA small subunit methyltransferase A n=1 Tax=Candidatus Erwinia haradaeae TaxID=1922217 RepID=A0A451DK11_9GAMM|nr:16S rRNA (adenine(1518)-N(6)/adenine(1519)-N(6))-dimethyltransferase RsmA [Candidatus Erwinia haradaeae]VFP87065.1 Ribosomal RNA small subunit methyltransferase A [Candidatus Erwinia haradaeae]